MLGISRSKRGSLCILNDDSILHLVPFSYQKPFSKVRKTKLRIFFLSFLKKVTSFDLRFSSIGCTDAEKSLVSVIMLFLSLILKWSVQFSAGFG